MAVTPLAWANGRWGSVVYVNTPGGYALNSRWGPGTHFGIHQKHGRGCPLELSGASRQGWLQLTDGTWVAGNWVTTTTPRERMACISAPTAQTVAVVNTPPGYALNIRRGPGTDYPLVGQYIHGSRLPFTGQFNGAWTELTDGTWVDGSFLQFSPGQGPSGQPTPTPTPTPQPTPTPDPYIQDLQQRLKQLGYLPPNFVVSGVYDAETQAAVRTFQRINGLPETGTVDAATGQALYNATRPPEPPAVRQMRVKADDREFVEALAGPGPEYEQRTRYKNGDIVTTTGQVVGNWTEIQGNMWIFSAWLQPL
ncbi:MAG: peptidoglycan-binding protein [Leptolyngbya sp.]|nr:peptidoglycan-binding protein [Leptolyngbya sp.]